MKNEFDDILMDIFEETKPAPVKASDPLIQVTAELKAELRAELKKEVFDSLQKELDAQRIAIGCKESILNRREQSIHQKERELQQLIASCEEQKKEQSRLIEKTRKLIKEKDEAKADVRRTRDIIRNYNEKQFKNRDAERAFELGVREVNRIIKSLQEDLLEETKEYCEKLKRQTDIDCAKRRQLSAGIPGLPLPLDIRRVKHNWNPLPGEKRYNYVYRILFPTTGKEYIGKHSTNEWDDGYKGSGAEIQLMLQEDLNEAVKEILYMANSSDEAYYAESIILGTPGYLEHPNVYNKGVSRLRESDTTDKALWDSIVERIIPSKFINI